MKIFNYLNSKKSVQKIERLTLKIEKYFKMGLKDRDIHLRIFALAPLALSYAIIAYSYNNLNEAVPLWQTKPWGEGILSAKINLYLIPLISTLFTITAFLLSYLAKKFYFTYLSQILLTGGILFNTFSLITVWSIVMVSAKTPLKFVSLSPQTQSLLGLLAAGFMSSYLLLPKFIAWTVKHGIVTDPTKHQHPGMILTKPSSRGGGFAFSVLVVVLSLIFLERNPLIVGTMLAVFIAGLIGLLDDYQNTHPKSKLKNFENPMLRLLILLPIPVIVMMCFGVVAGYINNPFDGNIELASFSFTLFGKMITPLPYLFTLIWTIAIMNMISWSNGVDGQFGGVAGIALLVVGLLSLRLVETEPTQLTTAKLAFLASGAAFGLIKHTWHPSKIMWGFGAISVGILLSALSIASRAKVATAIMVILIPFLDGFITIFRRILQWKNPLKGDRGHMHHLLLERGWSPKKVAVFYWLATAVFGIIGLLSADRSTALVTLTLGGIVASVIIALNISTQFNRRKVKKLEATKTKTAGTEKLSQLG